MTVQIAMPMMTDDEWRAALDAEIAQQDTAEERFGLMLSAMVGDAQPDAYTRGKDDYNSQRYAPPNPKGSEYDDYVRGYNDAWKAAENIKWFRR